MKLAIFGDTHCGARQDNDFYIRHQERFFGDVFFPYLEDNNITTVIHDGDMNDKRRAINIKSLSSLNRSLINPLIAGEYDYWQILGNHDIYYKNTRELSSVVELFRAHEGNNFHIVRDPMTVDFDGRLIYLCPWLIPDELEKLDKVLGKTSAKICIGHFELYGFELMKGVTMTHGLDPGALSQFDVVMSGHYHTPSRHGNVMYIGAPYQMSYADVDDRKRFIIFDTETYKIDVIYNDDPVFIQFIYTDDIDIDSVNYDEFNDVNLKLVVETKVDIDKFNTFMGRVDKAKPFTITTLDRYVFQQTDDETANVDTDDTLSILVKSVDTMDVPDERKPRIRTIYEQLYIEATAS